MNTEKLLAALEDGENRTAEALRVTDPASETYAKLLESLQHTLWIESYARGMNVVMVSHATEDAVTPAKKTPTADEPVGKEIVEEAIKNVHRAARKVKDAAQTEAPAPAEEAPATEPEPAAEPEPTPEPELAPASEIKPCPKPEHQLTKAEVRTQLSAYANSGADVAVLMQGMGYARLSDVPESRYAELLELAKKAVQ